MQTLPTIVTILLSIFFLSASAFPTDMLILTNGTTYTGELLEYKPGAKAVFKTGDGKVLSFLSAEISNAVKIKDEAPTNTTNPCAADVYPRFNTLIFNPLAFAISYGFPLPLELVIDYQRTINDYVSLSIRPKLILYTIPSNYRYDTPSSPSFGLFVGTLIFPFNRTTGFYLKAGVGFGECYAFIYPVAGIGYQWKLDRSIVLDFTVNVNFTYPWVFATIDLLKLGIMF